MKKLASLFVALFSLVWLTGAGWLPLATGGYVAQGVYFDATTSTKRNANFVGIADSKVGTISFWYKAHEDTLNQLVLEEGFGVNGGGLASVFRLSTGIMRIGLNSATNTNIAFINSTSTFKVADGWKHFLASWNLATATLQVYVEDAVEVSGSNSSSNVTINYNDTTPQWFFFDPGSPGNADLADMWFDPTTAIDLSVIANRRKFISASLAPVNLGSTCELPTGTSPILCVKGPTNNWLTNLGTGGNFLLNSGTLQASGSNPP